MPSTETVTGTVTARLSDRDTRILFIAVTIILPLMAFLSWVGKEVVVVVVSVCVYVYVCVCVCVCARARARVRAIMYVHIWCVCVCLCV